MKRGRGRDMSFVALRYNITKIQSKKYYDILDVINMKFYALKSFIAVPNYQKLHIVSTVVS